jgi:hypothetical protein
MPAGPSELGFVYFAAAKLVGYTAFCKWVIAPQLASTEGGASNALSASGSDTGLILNSIDADASEGRDPILPSAWKAGAIRTLIGVVVGAVVGLAFWRIPYFANHDLFDNGMFFVIPVPVRVAEWWLLLAWVYWAFPISGSWRMAIIGEGIVGSFALDALGVIFAFVMPGGRWVCRPRFPEP